MLRRLAAAGLPTAPCFSSPVSTEGPLHRSANSPLGITRTVGQLPGTELGRRWPGMSHRCATTGNPADVTRLVCQHDGPINGVPAPGAGQVERSGRSTSDQFFTPGGLAKE